MSNPPKVSIITVSFNAEAFIERTIQSIVEQTYPNIEYLIIDGASKDNTVNIIKKYAAHVTTWISERDKSLYDAMNKGLERATGDYVVFMNAGDRISHREALADMMAGADGADLVYAKAVFVDEQGNQRPWHKTPPPPNKINAKSFQNGMVVCHQCMVVKRAIAPQYSLAPWKIASDIDWSIRVMKNVKKAHFHDAVFCLFLEGGLSNERRLQAVKERFRISVAHFGVVSAVLEQFKIAAALVKKRLFG